MVLEHQEWTKRGSLGGVPQKAFSAGEVANGSMDIPYSQLVVLAMHSGLSACLCLHLSEDGLEPDWTMECFSVF